MGNYQFSSNYKLNMDQLLEITVNSKASDLHLVVGYPPALRIAGKIQVLDLPSIKPKEMESILTPILDENRLKKFNDNLELDFSYSIDNLARFRCNIMLQRGTYAAAFRVVPYDVPKFESLGLIPEIEDLCNLSRGLVLVTGPTGSGKSTTLAALINTMNETRNLNIVTVEDPIEFLHRHEKSMVKQREIGLDTHSFNNALRHVLRHDPDVIMIGEMRDQESVSIALTAAETGHLVFSTLHTQTAPLTISRIVDIFSHEKRQQIRMQVANSLQAIISQQLIPLVDNNERAAAVEYMVTTPAIKNLIREGKDHQIYSSIQTGNNKGMQTMDQSLVSLYRKGQISRENLLGYCIDKKEIERLISRMGMKI